MEFHPQIIQPSFLIVLLATCIQSGGSYFLMRPNNYTVSVHTSPASSGRSEARKITLTEASFVVEGHRK